MCALWLSSPRSLPIYTCWNDLDATVLQRLRMGVILAQSGKQLQVTIRLLHPFRPNSRQNIAVSISFRSSLAMDRTSAVRDTTPLKASARTTSRRSDWTSISASAPVYCAKPLRVSDAAGTRQMRVCEWIMDLFRSQANIKRQKHAGGFVGVTDEKCYPCLLTSAAGPAAYGSLHLGFQGIWSHW